MTKKRHTVFGAKGRPLEDCPEPRMPERKCGEGAVLKIAGTFAGGCECGFVGPDRTTYGWAQVDLAAHQREKAEAR